MKAIKSALLILIIIGIVFLVRNVFLSSKGDNFLDEVREKEIKSFVTKKYINYDNHNIAFLVYGTTDSIIVYRDWWEKVSVGDSIIKPKGSVEIVIKNSKSIKNFNYDDKFGLD